MKKTKSFIVFTSILILGIIIGVLISPFIIPGRNHANIRNWLLTRRYMSANAEQKTEIAIELSRSFDGLNFLLRQIDSPNDYVARPALSGFIEYNNSDYTDRFIGSIPYQRKNIRSYSIDSLETWASNIRREIKMLAFIAASGKEPYANPDFIRDIVRLFNHISHGCFNADPDDDIEILKQKIKDWYDDLHEFDSIHDLRYKEVSVIY